MTVSTSHFSVSRSIAGRKVTPTVALGPYSHPEGVSLVTERIPDLAAAWICQGEYDEIADKTLEVRQYMIDKLMWFLDQNDFKDCGKQELQSYFIYLSTGHKNPAGRWSSPDATVGSHINVNCLRPMRPASRKTYYAYLRAFFAYCKRQGYLIQSPFDWLDTPRIPKDQKEPYSKDDIEEIVYKYCERTRYPARNKAIIMLFFDTGLRVSEMANLTMGDLDFHRKHLNVLGKGSKRRIVRFGQKAGNLLWVYLYRRYGDPKVSQPVIPWHTISADDPIFGSQSGSSPLKSNSITHLVHQITCQVSAPGVRPSPHTLRHSFAIAAYRNGARVTDIQDALGHESLHMTQVYLKRAQIDGDQAHRRYSPGDSIGKRKKRQ